MTNHHAPSVFAHAGNLLHIWFERSRQRRELLQWSERDIRDAGLSSGEVMYEAGKPFWQA
jgi:uncharacterized protein YjiS (DUF1127 family)